MKNALPRRDFLQFAGLAAAGSLVTTPLAAARPAEGTAGPRPRLLTGCCAYSYRKYLQPGTMTMEDFILKCAEMGVLGAEMTAYWLKSTDRAYLLSLRHLAFTNSVILAGVRSGPDSRLHLLEAEKAKRREAQEEIKRWVDITERLGASHMRIFAGSVPDGVSAAQGMDWAVESMKVVCVSTRPRRASHWAWRPMGGSP